MATVSTSVEWNGSQKKRDMNDGMIIFLTRGINIVDASAKTKVPVDEGTLRGSLTKNVDKPALVATESTNIEYAPFVEFGLRSNPNYPKQPFLRPALSDNIDKLLRIARDEGRKAVDR